MHHTGSAPAAEDSPALAAPVPARQPWPGLNPWWSLAAAVAAGLALAGAFPPFGFWPLAAAGPALLVLAIWGKRRLATFTLALACGLVFFVTLLSWLVNVAWYAWLALGLAEALVFAVLALALRPLLRLPVWPLAVAGWWVAQEAVHDRFPWGFPWGRLAMSQPDAPTAGWVAIGGPTLLTFLLALAGAGLAYLAIEARADWRSRISGLAVAAVTCGLVLAGNLAWSPPSGPARTT
ncbi:MAG TPA: apolipoprotein N-acyltransferase, partial [Streptosporangiaceae bacterium]|nr:apolipoprotein N-acyltransferase [Streptosporangiaceae bacterium]